MGKRKSREEKLRESLEDLSPPELAQEIKGTEGLRWSLEHNSADGRIGGDVSADILTLQESVQIMAEVFARKCRIDVKDTETMRKRIQKELGKLDRVYANRWKEIRKVGATFMITGGGRFRKGIKDIFETMGVYSTDFAIGPDEVVLARVQGTGEIAFFFSDDACELRPVPVRRKYRWNGQFVRSGGKFVKLSGADQQKWNQVCESGAVFKYDGPRRKARGTFEVFYNHYRIGKLPKGRDAQIVIAKAYDQHKVAEFTAADAPHITVLNLEPRYVEVTGHGHSIPVLNLFN